MAHPFAVAEIRAHLEEIWDGPIIDESQTLEEGAEAVEDDAPLHTFIAIQYPTSSSRQASMGAPGENWFRERGAAWVIMFVDRDRKAELQLAREKCEEIANHFRSKDVGPHTRTLAPGSPNYTDENDQGGWTRLSFAIPYQCDIQA